MSTTPNPFGGQGDPCHLHGQRSIHGARLRARAFCNFGAELALLALAKTSTNEGCTWSSANHALLLTGSTRRVDGGTTS